MAVAGQYDPCAFTPQSYFYLAWALNGRPGEDYLMAGVDPNNAAISAATAFPTYINAAFLLKIAAMTQAQVTAGPTQNAYDTDITNFTNGNNQNVTIYRLREGIERFFITDINNPAATALAQTTIPVMQDMFSVAVANFNHVPGGANVLFMDGHVSFLKYPSDFPVTRAFSCLIGMF